MATKSRNRWRLGTEDVVRIAGAIACAEARVFELRQVSAKPKLSVNVNGKLSDANLCNVATA